jgi:hypothetical protein
LKNKHAKGPDGNPVAALNAGRGRGRPKKTASFGGGVQPGYRTSYASNMYNRGQYDATDINYFKTLERCGGPIFPDSGFKDVYNEIYVNKLADEEPKEEEE